MRALTHTLSLTGLLLTAAVLGNLVLPSGAPSSEAGSPGPGGQADVRPSPADRPAGVPREAARPAAARLAAAATPVPTAASPDPDDAPYYAPGQYTARYDQTRNTWRLLPVDGAEVVIDAGDCSTGATASPGVWLLVVEADGRAALVAPSATRLADGTTDHVALRDCDHASGRELAVPASVLGLLTANTGAIYVDD